MKKKILNNEQHKIETKKNIEKMSYGMYFWRGKCNDHF